MNAPFRTPTTSKSNAGGRLRPADHLVRSCTAAIVGRVKPGGYDFALKSMYGDDRITPLLLRAAVSPGTMASTEWAGILAGQAVVDFVSTLGPVSAASALLRAGLQLQFDNRASLIVPGMVASSTLTGMVAEGAPIPVHALTVSGPTLVPRKAAALVAFTREIAMSSNIEVMVRQALTESAGLTLDSAILGTGAASDASPAGLRNGVAALPATTGGTEAAMGTDLGNLAAAVAPVAGTQIAFVAAPGEAAKIALRSNSFPYPVLASGALAAGTVMAVATNALVAAVDPVPEINASNETALVMRDDPTHIGTAGSPATVGAPTQSLYQNDMVGLRLILSVSWGLRTTGAVAWVSSVSW